MTDATAWGGALGDAQKLIERVITDALWRWRDAGEQRSAARRYVAANLYGAVCSPTQREC